MIVLRGPTRLEKQHRNDTNRLPKHRPRCFPHLQFPTQALRLARDLSRGPENPRLLEELSIFLVLFGHDCEGKPSDLQLSITKPRGGHRSLPHLGPKSAYLCCVLGSTAIRSLSTIPPRSRVEAMTRKIAHRDRSGTLSPSLSPSLALSVSLSQRTASERAERASSSGSLAAKAGRRRPSGPTPKLCRRHGPFPFPVIAPPRYLLRPRLMLAVSPLPGITCPRSPSGWSPLTSDRGPPFSQTDRPPAPCTVRHFTGPDRDRGPRLHCPRRGPSQ